MTPIQVPTQPPRDPASYPALDLTCGLRPYYFFGVFFLLGIWAPLCATQADPTSIEHVLFTGVFGTLCVLLIGGGLLRFARRRRRERALAFSEGVPVEVEIVRHDRQLVFYQSSRLYSVGFELELEGQRIRRHISTRDPKLHRALPVGAKTLALVHPASKTIFLPEEVGVTLVVEAAASPDQR